MAGKFIPLNDAEKKLLSDRYLDLQFEQDIDEFVCVRCDMLAISHFFTNCGHLLCLNCKRIIDNGGFTCQQCKKIITNASEHRDEFEKQLLALRTKCPNTNYGCQLTTSLAQIPEHVGMCKFNRKQALPALSTESNTMFNASDKINEMNGQIANLEIGVTKINEHIEELKTFNMELKMGLKSLRSEEIPGQIQTIETNLKKLIADEFQAMKEEINLEISTIKKKLEKGHFEEFIKYKPSVQLLIDCFLFGSAQEQQVFESLCLKWNIKDKDLLIPEGGSDEHLSDIFPVYGFPLKAQLKLIIDSDGDIYLQLCFKDEERQGQEVDTKPYPTVTFIIKDLSGHNKHIIRYKHYLFQGSLQYNEFGYWRDLFKKSVWSKLISPLDNSMEVLVLVEPPTIINKLLSVDGTIMDTIEHYSIKLQMEKERLIECHVSPAFLTHAGGYRAAVQMNLDVPIAENKRGLGAEICFVSGEFDSQLEDKFKHETSVTLINQLDATKNITVVIQSDFIASYDMKIASWDVISSGAFLVNNSLKYHVAIKSII